jgi:nucleotide-binding universal stress UspA family protein
VNDEEDVLYIARSEHDPEAMRGPRVMAGIDCSEGSKAALLFALQDAARRGVPLEVVTAYRPPEYWMDFNVVGEQEEARMREQLRAQTEDRLRSFVDAVTADLPLPLPEIHIRAARGEAADALVREAHGADLLVVGSRGHGAFHTMLLGSTSMQVTMHATCPVTVVHSPEAHRHRLRLHRERRSARRDRPEVASAN